MKPKQLWWFSARLTHPDPLVQGENLHRARARFARLEYLWDIHHPERVLWAPWFALADAGTAEAMAWHVIEHCIPVCDGLVMDLDGLAASTGMARERTLANAHGMKVEEVA
jgi:hypothetical protein